MTGLFNIIIKGGLFIWPIMFCSVVAMTVVFERLYYFHRTRARSRNLPARVRSLLSERKAAQALQLCKADKGFTGHFLSVGIKISDRPEEDRRKILRRAGSRVLEDSEKRLRVLSVVSNISTMLGLLGTVTGMIQTFIKIQATGGLADVAVLAGGIWEALLTTAAGLSVAIPTIVFYHYFESLTDTRAIEFKNIAADVFDIH